MTTTNVYTREPAKLDYASPVQFRFKMTKIPMNIAISITINCFGILPYSIRKYGNLS